MVDPVGPKTVSNVRGVTPLAPAKAVRSPASVASGSDELVSEAASTAKDMAANAPVDAERVAQIKAAVQNGTFPIYPGKIADRLIALKNNWNPHDKA